MRAIYEHGPQLVTVRHGRTPFNQSGRANGRIDEELLPGALDDVPALVNELKVYDVRKVVASPLLRARRTAEAIATGLGTAVDVDARLAEVSFGSFDGKDRDAFVAAFGVDSTALLDTYTYDLQPHGGEAAPTVRERVTSFLADVDGGGSVVVVSHGGVLRWIHHLLTGEHISSTPNLGMRNYALG